MSDKHEQEPEAALDEPLDGWSEVEGFDPEVSNFPVRVMMNRKGFLIFRTREGFRGVALACPHLRASLHDAVLMANSTVLRCSQHNFTFKLSDGRGVNSPSHRLPVFEIKIENGVTYGRAVKVAG